MATLVIAHSHVHLHYNTQAEKRDGSKTESAAKCRRCRDGETYSKSAHVNRPALLVAWTGPPPVFGGNIFTHPLH